MAQLNRVSCLPFKWAKALGVSLAATSTHVQALGISSGDWVSPAPGHPVLAWHVVQTENYKIYQHGDGVNDRAKLKVSSTLLRYTYPIRVAEYVVTNPQFGAIAADISANHASGLNDPRGLSDPFVTVPFFFTGNNKSGPDNGSLSQDPLYQVNAAVC